MTKLPDYPTWKRYLISTAETFLVTFGTTFFIMLDTALSTGTIDKAIFLSIGISALLSAVKVTVKFIRESYFQQK